jgi:hypothetical protein
MQLETCITRIILSKMRVSGMSISGASTNPKDSSSRNPASECASIRRRACQLCNVLACGCSQSVKQGPLGPETPDEKQLTYRTSVATNRVPPTSEKGACTVAELRPEYLNGKPTGAEVR